MCINILSTTFKYGYKHPYISSWIIICIIIQAVMQIEENEVPQRMVNRINLPSSNSDDDENLFKQRSLKSESSHAPKKEGKMMKKKNFLKRAMKGSDSDGSAQEKEKPKKSRLLKSKLKKKNDNDNEDSYNNAQSQIGSSQKLSQQQSIRQSSDSDKVSMNDSDLEAMKLFEGSFIQEERKTKKAKKQKTPKQKIKKLTKKEIMNIKSQQNWKLWEQKFQKESSEDEKQKDGKEQRQHYTGMEFLKKDKNMITRKNRMFEFDELENCRYQEEVVENKEFKLELRPGIVKTKTMEDFGFFKKAEKMFKARHTDYLPTDPRTFESDLDSSAIKKAKQSLSKLISSSNIEDHHQLEIEVKMPVLVKGKSNQILNNTLLLKKMTSMDGAGLNKQNSLIHQPSIQSLPASNQSYQPSKKKTYTRAELFADMSKEVRLRKSKTISLEEIRNSFKRTEFSELDEIKRYNEKKRKILEGVDSDLNDSDFKLEDDGEGSEKDIEVEKQNNRIIDSEGIIINLEQIKKKLRLEEENQNKESLSKKPCQLQNYQIENPENIKENDEDGNQNQDDEIVSSENKMIEEQIEENIDEEIDYNQQIINDPLDEQQYQRLLRLDQDQEDLEQEEAEEMSIEADDEQGQNDQVNDNDDMEQEHSLENANPNYDDESGEHKHKNIRDRDLSDKENSFNKDNQMDIPNFRKDGMFPIQEADNEQDQSKKVFNRLRKMAVVRQQTKKKKQELRLKRQEEKKRAEKFFDDEAELGSDNEDNDFVRKQINRKEEEEEEKELGDDLDGELEDLIDNAVYLNDSDEEYAFQKFMEDERLREKEELTRVIHGQFRVMDKDDRNEFGDDQNLDREMRLKERYEEMKRQNEEDDAFYIYNKLAEAGKKERSRSQSDASDYENNPFQQELKKQIEREKAKRQILPEPEFLKAMSRLKKEETPEKTKDFGDKKFKIHFPVESKRGSLMTGEAVSFADNPKTEMSKMYKNLSFFPSSGFKFPTQKSSKASKPRKPREPKVNKEKERVQEKQLPVGQQTL